MEEEFSEDIYHMSFDIEDIRLLYQCVCKRIETWEGYPARPIREQTHLWYLRDELYRAILDYKFHEM
jgi:hypothetical protein